MSNARKIKNKTKRICEACQRGEHTGQPHRLDGTPVSPQQLRLEESIARAVSQALN